MADLRKIRVMISSRSLSPVFADNIMLGDIRQRLQTYLESIRLSLPGPTGKEAVPIGRDQPLFEVWIHEKDPGRTINQSTLQMSLKEINRADVVIVLYTGEAGSAPDGGSLGICHAELQEAWARRPEIVSILRLLPLKRDAAARDKQFQQHMASLNPPMLDVSNETELQAKVVELLQQRVAELVKRGATVGARKRDRGQALDWNRLDLVARRAAMHQALARHLGATPLAAEERLYQAELPGAGTLATHLDAVSAAWTVGPAREAVGQPHLRDHLHSPSLDNENLPGVLHLIACHRRITETQAARLLGTPDVVAVTSDFGVYAADRVQQIQYILLADCSDDTATALALRRLKEWLVTAGTGEDLARRAASRRRILSTVAQEIEVASGEAPVSSGKGRRKLGS